MIWKFTSAVLAILCLALLFLLIRDRTTPQLMHKRLIGTWISDRDRTLENLKTQFEFSDDRIAKFSEFFGRLKVTFTDTTITTEMDDFVETNPYTIVGSDAHSVVIHSDSPNEPELEVLKLSSFVTIHFEDEDNYWVVSEIGGHPEYFTRFVEP